VIAPWLEDAWRALDARVREKRVPHALLIAGSAGLGKRAFAEAFAARLLCTSPTAEGFACGTCRACSLRIAGSHPDSVSVTVGLRDDGKPRTEIVVEQIRELSARLSMTPQFGGLQVIRIDPAEFMNIAAANALLKTLEEPPPGSLIVLVSDRPARLLPTIRSRCRLVTLHAPQAHEALAWLREEAIPNPETALAAAGGAPLLARDLAVPEEVEFRRRLLAELSRPEGAEPLVFAERFERGAVERFIHWMQTWVADLVEWRLAGRARYHGEHSRALAAKARTADLDRLFDLDRELATARGLAAHPLNPRLLAEHLLMAYNRATLAEKTT